MSNERLTWEEIKQKYPHQNVGLIDVEYANSGIGGPVKSAVVVCTDCDTDRNEIAWKAIQGELIMVYTTFDEDSLM